MKVKKLIGIILAICLAICLIFVVSKLYIKSTRKGCPNPDKDGFCIKDDVLIGYTGLKRKITIPSNVRLIDSNAFNKEMKRGRHLEVVIVPGTVKEIKGSAFNNSSLSELIIKEGVEKIGMHPFVDSYINVVWFPKSIKEIGKGRILDCSEGCYTKNTIYVYKDSYMDNYLKNINFSHNRIVYIEDEDILK